MLVEIKTKKIIEARAMLGFYPCNADDQDDIEVYDPVDGKTMINKFCTLR